MVYGTQCERKSRLGHPPLELSVKRRGGGAPGPKGLSLRGSVGWGTWPRRNQCELGSRLACQAYGTQCLWDSRLGRLAYGPQYERNSRLGRMAYGTQCERKSRLVHPPWELSMRSSV